jgi:hypothetical protein
VATRYRSKYRHWQRQIGIAKCWSQISGRELIQEGKKYKTLPSPWWRHFNGDTNTFLPLTISYRNLTQNIEFNRRQFNILPFLYINHVRGADANGGSSVITVTRIQVVEYEARIRGFSLVLSLQIGIEVHIDFFWMSFAEKSGRGVKLITINIQAPR